MKLLFEIYKNFKLIFRNWSSLILVVLAPLFLILLAGYSFSGDQLHDINIGIHSEGDADLSALSESVDFGSVLFYGSTGQCISDMIDEEAHICLDIRGDIQPKEGSIPSGEVTFYYDNTRKRISLLLMTELKDYFGLTAEQISLMSTQEMISKLQELLSFLNERIDDVDSIRNESQQIMSDLQERKAKLISIRDEFEPRYLAVKRAQAEFNQSRNSLENVSEEMMMSIREIRDLIAEAEENISGPLSGPTSAGFAGLLDSEIAGLEESMNSTVRQADNMSRSLDRTVAELDRINLLLNKEINMTDEYITLINRSTIRIDELSAEAKGRIEEASEIDPSLAGKIANPITQQFKALLPDVRDVQLAFPILFSTVIVFISMLFSNIITSLEINNDAYTRNILAPVDDLLYTSGLVITNFIVVSFQVCVLLAVAQLNFGIEVTSHLAEIIPVSAVLILIFVFTGMIIAYMSHTIQASILSSTFLALAFFLFSDALNALEAMPELAAEIAVFNPIVIVNSILRKVLFFDIRLPGIQEGLGMLVVYLAAAALVLVTVSKIKNRQRL
ncbi:MAG: ABC transporter permease [Candidatus Woesearchaeota archaeon]